MWQVRLPLWYYKVHIRQEGMQGNTVKAIWLWNPDPYSRPHRKNRSSRDVIFNMVAGYTFIDWRQHEEIWRKFAVHSNCETSELYRIGWRDHITRIPHNCSVTITWNYKLRGHAGERPKKRWWESKWAKIGLILTIVVVVVVDDDDDDDDRN
jgi:hypothetical protein